jgi:hypothetical protein
MHQKTPATLIGVLLAGWVLPAAADSTQARCEIYPRGSDMLETMLPCTFSQRQGTISISRNDGVTYDLSPVGDRPGNFRDQDGQPVYRQRGLGEVGLIFRFPTESLFVSWDLLRARRTGGRHRLSEDNAAVQARVAGTMINPPPPMSPPRSRQRCAARG